MSESVLTAEAVAALERRAEQATHVDAIAVSKAELAELVEAWRNWDLLEAMPRYRALEHDYDRGADVWWVENCHMGEAIGMWRTPAAALAAAQQEESWLSHL